MDTTNKTTVAVATATPAQYAESNEQLTAFTSLADNFLSQGFNKFQYAAKAVNLDQYSEEIGIGPISKELTIDRVKTILAAYAMLTVLNKVRSNVLKIGLVVGVGGLILKNKDSIMGVFNTSEYIADRLPSQDTYDSYNDMSGLSGTRCIGDFGC